MAAVLTPNQLPNVANKLAQLLGLPADTPLVEWRDIHRWWDAPDDHGTLDTNRTERIVGFSVRRHRSSHSEQLAPHTGRVLLALDGLTRPRVGERLRLALPAVTAVALGYPDTVDGRARFTGRVAGVQLDLRAGLADVELVSERTEQLDGRAVTTMPAETDAARAARLLGDYAGTVDPAVFTMTEIAGEAGEVFNVRAQLDQLAGDTGGHVVETRAGLFDWHAPNHRRNLSGFKLELTADQVGTASGSWSSDVAAVANYLVLYYGAELQPAELPNYYAPGYTPPVPKRSVEVADTQSYDVAGVWQLPRVELHIDTGMATEADALLRGRQLVGHYSLPLWQLPAVTVDVLRQVPAAELGAALSLDFGDVLRVVGWPRVGVTPSTRMLVEGIEEQATRTSWSLQLAVSEPAATAWPITWAEIDPAVTWADAPTYGTDRWGNVDGLTWAESWRWHPVTTGVVDRWRDVPTDLPWLDVDPATSWATWRTPGAEIQSMMSEE